MIRDARERTGRRRYRRPACLLAFGLAMSLGVAYAVAYGATMVRAPRENPAAPLSVRVAPSTRTVQAGDSVTYSLRVGPGDPGRTGLGGRTRLSVTGALPTGTTMSFSPQSAVVGGEAANRRSNLTIATGSETAAGTYGLKVRARRPHRRGAALITLIVTAPAGATPPIAAPGPTTIPTPPPPPEVTAPDAFAISGTLPGTLRPGSEEPLDLSLENHESTDLTIASLSVRIAAVGAPQSDALHPCGPADFSVEQFSGTPGFTLPASATATLGELGFGAAQRPRISMLDSAVNQDGCKGASLQLAFAGTATEETP